MASQGIDLAVYLQPDLTNLKQTTSKLQEAVKIKNDPKTTNAFDEITRKIQGIDQLFQKGNFGKETFINAGKAIKSVLGDLGRLSSDLANLDKDKNLKKLQQDLISSENKITKIRQNIKGTKTGGRVDKTTGKFSYYNTEVERRMSTMHFKNDKGTEIKKYSDLVKYSKQLEASGKTNTARYQKISKFLTTITDEENIKTENLKKQTQELNKQLNISQKLKSQIKTRAVNPTGPQSVHQAQARNTYIATLSSLDTADQHIKAGLDKYKASQPTGGKTRAEIDALTGSLKQQPGAIGKAVQNFTSYTLILGTVRRLARSAKQTIQILDKALTEQAMVAGKSKKEMEGLLVSYQNIARQTGSTTKEVAEVATQYFRQGKSQKDALTLTEAAVSAARVGAISTAESVDYLTTAINGFHMAAEDAMRVSDKFAALAANSATNYEELAVALSKCASQANLAGMSMDYTLGLLAKGIETTREAPETIGTALKTIIARMREMTDYGKTLEGDVDINNLERQLGYVDIALRNTQGELRSTEDVLDEIGRSWDTFTANQQAALAKALAGTRQQSRLISIMQDYDRTLELVDISQDSMGATSAQMATYMTSLQAATNQTSVAWEGLVTQLLNADAFINILDIVTKLLTALSEFAATDFGSLTILTTIAALMGKIVAFKFQQLRINRLNTLELKEQQKEARKERLHNLFSGQVYEDKKAEIAEIKKTREAKKQTAEEHEQTIEAEKQAVLSDKETEDEVVQTELSKKQTTEANLQAAAERVETEEDITQLAAETGSTAQDKTQVGTEGIASTQDITQLAAERASTREEKKQTAEERKQTLHDKIQEKHSRFKSRGGIKGSLSRGAKGAGKAAKGAVKGAGNAIKAGGTAIKGAVMSHPYVAAAVAATAALAVISTGIAYAAGAFDKQIQKMRVEKKTRDIANINASLVKTQQTIKAIDKATITFDRFGKKLIKTKEDTEALQKAVDEAVGKLSEEEQTRVLGKMGNHTLDQQIEELKAIKAEKEIAFQQARNWQFNLINADDDAEEMLKDEKNKAVIYDMVTAAIYREITALKEKKKAEIENNNILTEKEKQEALAKNDEHYTNLQNVTGNLVKGLDVNVLNNAILSGNQDQIKKWKNSSGGWTTTGADSWEEAVWDKVMAGTGKRDLAGKNKAKVQTYLDNGEFDKIKDVVGEPLANKLLAEMGIKDMDFNDDEIGQFIANTVDSAEINTVDATGNKITKNAIDVINDPTANPQELLNAMSAIESNLVIDEVNDTEEIKELKKRAQEQFQTQFAPLKNKAEELKTWDSSALGFMTDNKISVDNINKFEEEMKEKFNLQSGDVRKLFSEMYGTNGSDGKSFDQALESITGENFNEKIKDLEKQLADAETKEEQERIQKELEAAKTTRSNASAAYSHLMTNAAGGSLSTVSQNTTKLKNNIADIYKKQAAYLKGEMSPSELAGFMESNPDFFDQKGAYYAFVSGQDLAPYMEAAFGEERERRISELTQQKRQAELEGNTKKAEEIQKEIDGLENINLLYGQMLDTKIEKEKAFLNRYKEIIKKQREEEIKNLEARKKAYQDYFKSIEEQESFEAYQEKRDNLIENINSLGASTSGDINTKRLEYQKQLEELEKQRLKELKENAKNKTIEHIDKTIEEIKEKLDKELKDNQGLIASLAGDGDEKTAARKTFVSNSIKDIWDNKELTNLGKQQEFNKLIQDVLPYMKENELNQILQTTTDTEGNVILNIGGDKVVNLGKKGDNDNIWLPILAKLTELGIV